MDLIFGTFVKQNGIALLHHCVQLSIQLGDNFQALLPKPGLLNSPFHVHKDGRRVGRLAFMTRGIVLHYALLLLNVHLICK